MTPPRRAAGGAADLGPRLENGRSPATFLEGAPCRKHSGIPGGAREDAASRGTARRRSRRQAGTMRHDLRTMQGVRNECDASRRTRPCPAPPAASRGPQAHSPMGRRVRRNPSAIQQRASLVEERSGGRQAGRRALRGLELLRAAARGVEKDPPWPGGTNGLRCSQDRASALTQRLRAGFSRRSGSVAREPRHRRAAPAPATRSRLRLLAPAKVVR